MWYALDTVYREYPATIDLLHAIAYATNIGQETAGVCAAGH